MKMKIKLNHRNIEYTLKVSKRARRMRLAIYPPTFPNTPWLCHGDEGRFQIFPAGYNTPREGGGIYCDGSFVVTIPQHTRQSLIEQFVIKKARWVIDKIEYFKKFPGRVFKRDDSDFIQYKKKALVFARERVEYFAQSRDFNYNKINIKNQKTRWGSCSRKGNLNFNYRIVFLPQGLADYLIVHELCHLKEFNHSRKFWNLVGAIMPDYLGLRRELKKNGMTAP